MLGVALLTAFSAVSAMDDLTKAENRDLQNAVDETSICLTQAPDYLDLAYVAELKNFCVARGKQKHARRLEVAYGQGILKQRRDVRHAIFGQPQAARFVDFPSSSSSSQD